MSFFARSAAGFRPWSPGAAHPGARDLPSWLPAASQQGPCASPLGLPAGPWTSPPGLLRPPPWPPAAVHPGPGPFRAGPRRGPSGAVRLSARSAAAPRPRLPPACHPGPGSFPRPSAAFGPGLYGLGLPLGPLWPSALCRRRSASARCGRRAASVPPCALPFRRPGLGPRPTPGTPPARPQGRFRPAPRGASVPGACTVLHPAPVRSSTRRLYGPPPGLRTPTRLPAHPARPPREPATPAYSAPGTPDTASSPLRCCGMVTEPCWRATVRVGAGMRMPSAR